MTIQISTKLNSLTQQLPEGLLVDSTWLEQQGYSRALRHQYVAAGWLEQSGRGVFRRPRGQLSWEQVVISLQTLHTQTKNHDGAGAHLGRCPDS